MQCKGVWPTMLVHTSLSIAAEVSALAVSDMYGGVRVL